LGQGASIWTAAPPVAKAGSVWVYSDTGFILLGGIVERATGGL
jgi:CubicO group peptidase (beta-lactamase class C family)